MKRREEIGKHIKELLNIKSFADRFLRTQVQYYWSINMTNRNVTGTRLVVDFGEANKITRPLSCALPLINDSLLCLAGNRYFSSLDSIHGYDH
jgi:hypothetical protein